MEDYMIYEVYDDILYIPRGAAQNYLYLNWTLDELT